METGSHVTNVAAERCVVTAVLCISLIIASVKVLSSRELPVIQPEHTQPAVGQVSR
jgi:hypothetical protein